MTNHTVFTTTNGGDWVLLVNANDTVINAWPVDDDVYADYIRDGGQGDNWDAAPDFDYDNPTKIDDYGTECGRDGVIDSEERREFWSRNNA